MAVAFDAVGSAAGFNTSTPSTTPWLTWTHTAGAGGGTVIVALAWSSSTGFPPTVTSITYGGTIMAFLGSQASNNAPSSGGILLYGILGQAAGANTVLVKTTANPTDQMLGQSVSFTGATGFGTAVKASGNSAASSVTLTGTTAGNMCVSAEAHGTNAGATYTSGTRRFDYELSSASGAGAFSGGTIPAGGTVSLTATITADTWCAIGVEVQVLSSAGGQVEKVPQQLSRITKHRRGASQRPQYAVTPPSGTANPVTVSASASVPVPVLPSPFTGITSLGGTPGAGYFQTATGIPQFFLCDAGWGLIANAGRWGTGWQADMDNYLTTRAAQGFTAVFTTAIGTQHSGSPDDTGNTWDGTAPFTTAYTALNNTYWARVDYFLAKAANLGLVVVLDVLFTYCLSTPVNILFGINSGSNPGDYGTALGNRYKTGYPNLIWHFGDDYDGSGWPAVFSGVITGIRGTGDTHPASIENDQAGSTARYLLSDSGHASPYSWGSTYATHHWVYYYAQTYFAIEFAYTEPSPIPVVQGDGMYWGETAGGNAANDQAMRRQAWWAVSSGSRGYSTAQVAVHLWNGSGAAAAMTAGSWFTAWAANMKNLIAGLPNWHKLVPDTGSALVTSGRGTRATYNGAASQGWVDLTDAYVTASRVSDGSLAVIYLSHATTITIDQTKMQAGYTATWYDPASGAATAGTPGSTFNSTGQGTNSAGDADWVLVLQGPPVTLPDVVMATRIAP